MNIYVDFSLRLFVAGLMGVLIGLEREYRAKEAGYRTHFLVALGSALLMIVSQYGFMDVLEKDLVRLDPSRLAAQVACAYCYYITIIGCKHMICITYKRC